MVEDTGEGHRRLPEKSQQGATAEVLERHEASARRVRYLEKTIPGSDRQLPYFDFSGRTEPVQRKVMGELHEAALSDGKRVILEVGPGERLSPVETAVGNPDSVVFAVDGSYQPLVRYDSKLARDLGRRAQSREPVAVFFGLDGTKLDERLKFDRVQMAFPIPYDLPEFCLKVSEHVKRGGELVVLNDPLAHGEPTAKDVVAVLPEDFSCEIRMMPLSRITEMFGFSDTELHEAVNIPVLIAKRRK